MPLFFFYITIMVSEQNSYDMKDLEPIEDEFTSGLGFEYSEPDYQYNMANFNNFNQKRIQREEKDGTSQKPWDNGLKIEQKNSGKIYGLTIETENLMDTNCTKLPIVCENSSQDNRYTTPKKPTFQIYYSKNCGMETNFASATKDRNVISDNNGNLNTNVLAQHQATNNKTYHNFTNKDKLGMSITTKVPISMKKASRENEYNTNHYYYKRDILQNPETENPHITSEFQSQENRSTQIYNPKQKQNKNTKACCNQNTIVETECENIAKKPPAMSLSYNLIFENYGRSSNDNPRIFGGQITIPRENTVKHLKNFSDAHIVHGPKNLDDILELDTGEISNRDKYDREKNESNTTHNNSIMKKLSKSTSTLNIQNNANKKSGYLNIDYHESCVKENSFLRYDDENLGNRGGASGQDLPFMKRTVKANTIFLDEQSSKSNSKFSVMSGSKNFTHGQKRQTMPMGRNKEIQKKANEIKMRLLQNILTPKKKGQLCRIGTEDNLNEISTCTGQLLTAKSEKMIFNFPRNLQVDQFNSTNIVETKTEESNQFKHIEDYYQTKKLDNVQDHPGLICEKLRKKFDRIKSGMNTPIRFGQTTKDPSIINYSYSNNQQHQKIAVQKYFKKIPNSEVNFFVKKRV